MAPQVRIGASGFSYKEWLGAFYPAKLPGPKMLAYYAERLPTVEINYTFRAMPRRAMLERWAEQTPAHFRFALKAPQRITHFARLRNSAETIGFFAETAAALGRRRLGPAGAERRRRRTVHRRERSPDEPGRAHRTLYLRSPAQGNLRRRGAQGMGRAPGATG